MMHKRPYLSFRLKTFSINSQDVIKEGYGGSPWTRTQVEVRSGYHGHLIVRFEDRPQGPPNVGNLDASSLSAARTTVGPTPTTCTAGLNSHKAGNRQPSAAVLLFSAGPSPSQPRCRISRPTPMSIASDATAFVASVSLCFSYVRSNCALLRPKPPFSASASYAPCISFV